ATIIAAAVNTIPSPRTRRSRLEGTKAITTAPATGKKTAIEIADESQPLISRSSCDLEDQDRERHQQEHAAEQHPCIPLRVPGLALTEDPAGGAGRRTRAVHEPVDHG